jgi:hypothetical protein
MNRIHGPTVMAIVNETNKKAAQAANQADKKAEGATTSIAGAGIDAS